MKATISAKRKGDALITVRQNNRDKKLEIARMNVAAEKLTGYPSVEILGKNLQIVLADRIRETISDYIDFEDPSSDFASVARKIPNFQVLNKNGREVPVSLKVFYLISSEADKPEYELLMRDITLIKRMEELKEQLASNSDLGATDPITDLPSNAAVQSALQIAHSFVQNDPIEVSFVVAAVDNLGGYIDSYGEDVAIALVKSVAEEVKKTCRDEDIIGYLGEGDLGVVLLDCNTDNANAVLKRVKRNVMLRPIILINGKEVSVSISIAFIQLKAEYDLQSVYDACRETVVSIQQEGGDSIREV
jgi:diguanylate cyclase (GGDEF)-like protein/PAS domain S-box-containing protein